MDLEEESNNRTQQVISQLNDIVQQIASAAGHVSVAASQVIGTGDPEAVQKCVGATIQCSSATQRLAMAMAAMSEISQGVMPSRLGSTLAIAQSPHPLADVSTPAPCESLVESARSARSETAIEAASSATSERPERETEHVAPVAPVAPAAPLKPVELARPVPSAGPAMSHTAAGASKPVEKSKPAEPLRENRPASAAPVPAQPSVGPVRPAESRPIPPVGQVESAKAALLAKEAALKKQIESLKPAEPARSSSVPARPNEGESTNGTPNSTEPPRAAELLKSAEQPTTTQPVKPSAQVKALMAAKIAALRKKAEKSRLAQPATPNGVASPAVPQKRAEPVRPAQPAEQARPVQPARAVEQPRPAEQPRPVAQSKPVEQSGTTQPPRRAEQAKQAPQPRPAWQPRPADQSVPAVPSRLFEGPTRFEIPRLPDQARAPAPTGLDSLRKPAVTSRPAAPPKPVEAARSNAPSGLNQPPPSTASRQVEPARPPNAPNIVEAARSAPAQRPNEGLNRPTQPASRPANSTTEPVTDGMMQPSRMMHPSRKTRFAPENSIRASPQVNGRSASASIPTGPKARKDTNAQPSPPQRNGSSNNSSRPNNSNQANIPLNGMALNKPSSGKFDPLCRHCFGNWGWRIRTTNKLPPCTIDKGSKRTKCDHCYEQRLECVLIPSDMSNKLMELKRDFDNAVAGGGRYRSERRRFVQEYDWTANALLENDNKQKAQAKAPAPVPPRYDRYEPPKDSPPRRKRGFEGKPSGRGGKRRRKN